MDGIVNAVINKYTIKRIEDIIEDPVMLYLEVKSTCGTAMLKVPLPYINKLFEVMEINDINDLISRPCLAIVSDQILRTIGNFMFVDSQDLYSDPAEADEHNAKSWLSYEEYKRFIQTHPKVA